MFTISGKNCIIFETKDELMLFIQTFISNINTIPQNIWNKILRLNGMTKTDFIKQTRPLFYPRLGNVRYWTDRGWSDHDALQKVGENQSKNSKFSFIKRYGHDLGTYRYDEFRKSRSLMMTEQGYIERYGELEGTEKWREFREALAFGHTEEYYIQKFGEIDGKEKYAEINSKKDSSSLSYFIQKYGEKSGTDRYNNNKKDFSSIEYFISQYGEDEGKQKYLEKCSKHDTCSLSYFIQRYGVDTGTLKYKEKCSKSATNTLENYIRRYGDIEGIIKFNDRRETHIRNLKFFPNYSTESQHLFLEIEKRIKNQCFYATNGAANRSNEYQVLVKTDDGKTKIRFLDFFVPDKNICIEFDESYHNGRTESDIRRTIEISNAIENIKILRISEEMWKTDKPSTIEQCINFIIGT